MAAPAERHLLFGLIALQVGLIDQAQLVSAFQAWARDKSRPLSDHLVGLDVESRAAVEAMVALHLKKHEGDLEKSLAALPVGRSTQEQLAALRDADVNASLAHIGLISTEIDAGSTVTVSIGESTSEGARFRVLRPHARGGLGAVFVALDGELNREVALKQILDHHADDPSSRQRFLIEAEITGGLEHPGIVPVYGLGAYSDGRPYYAMRFVRGDSLKDAIARFHAGLPGSEAPGLELRRLLRRFLDVCNAMEYAHSRGILHRDLKPGNIIVGKYGETLVVDWGLAKALGKSEPTSEERTLMPSSASGSAETLPGQAMGTPAYMSPEQARGDLDALGPQSDVYSLGATLYCLLTGKPPFAGNDLGALLRSVQNGDFSSPRQLDPTIDKALEAVCRKAMALKPDDRYATAKSLADDIDRWLADEPVTAYSEPFGRRARRWMARNRTAVSAAAAALVMTAVGLGVVSFVQARANTNLAAANTALDLQRRRAEDREQQSIDAVKRFRDAVADNPELKDNPSLESLRKTLLKEPLAFFKSLRASLQADRDTKPESLARLAAAMHDYAHLTDEIGDTQDSLRSHEESLAIWEKLAAEHPLNPEYQHGLAMIHNCRANMLRITGQPDAAREAYESALAIFQKLADAHAADAQYQRALAVSQDNLGVQLSAVGQPDAARKAFESALKIKQKLAEAHPAVTSYQSDLADSRNNLGVLLLETGQPDAARKAYESALKIQQKLADAHPAVTEYQSDLARSHYNLGNLLRDTGQPDAARKAYESALKIQQKLADAHPAVTSYQSDLANCQVVLGNLLSDTGEPTAARKAYETSLAINKRLADSHPAVTLYQRELASSHSNLGNLLSDIGEPTAARNAQEAALAIRQKLADSHPAVTQYQSDLTNSHNNLGALLFKTGQPEAARKAFEAALPIQERLAREHPESPDHASGLGGLLNNMAEIDLDDKRFDAARDRLRLAIVWQKKALAVNPRNPTYRQFLTIHLRNLIKAARGLGRDAEDAVAERELAELASSDPRLAELAARLAAVMKGEAPKNNAERLVLAEWAYDTARFRTAARLWAEALEADSKLAADCRTQHPYSCAAALAAAGKGKDDPAPDEAAKAKLRRQARDWLTAELAIWAKLLESGPPEAKAKVAQTLVHWQKDIDLAGVRDPDALPKLSEEERKAWEGLWAEVDRLLKAAQGR